MNIGKDGMRQNVRGNTERVRKSLGGKEMGGRAKKAREGMKRESKWVRESRGASKGGSMVGCFGLSDG